MNKFAEEYEKETGRSINVRSSFYIKWLEKKLDAIENICTCEHWYNPKNELTVQQCRNCKNKENE